MHRESTNTSTTACASRVDSSLRRTEDAGETMAESMFRFVFECSLTVDVTVAKRGRSK